jgi:hypothetical protein
MSAPTPPYLCPCTPQSYSGEAVLGDRAHVLLLQANISLSQPPQRPGGPAPAPIRLNSTMSWIGTSPSDERAGPLQGREGAADPVHDVWVNSGRARGAVVVPEGAPADTLQLQQLVLWQLPQGPDAARAAADGHGSGARGVPWELFTLVMWAVER